MTPNAAVLRLDAIAAALRRVSGWRRFAIAFAAGAGAALAQAPTYALPLMAIGYSALVFLIDGARASRAPARSGFAAGWFFGFGYFLPGLYWLGFAFMVQAEEFAWMAPFAVLGMPAFLALFFGAAGAVIARAKVEGWRRVLFAAGALMIAEYARGHILTGLPWNLPGQALAGTAMGAQTAAFWGVYGLSLVALLIAMAPAAGRGLVKGAGLMIAATAALYAVGAGRLALHPLAYRQDAFVRIVQPNIPQREKIDGDLWSRNYQRHIDLSAAPGPDGGVLFVLWPENAVPVIDEVPEGLAEVGRRLPKNAVLVTGAVRRETDAAGKETVYNSMAVVAETATGRKVAAHYDKHHLVPFGEYLPMSALLRRVGLAQLAPYDEGFAFGTGPKTIAATAGPPFAALICYEAIFPGRVYPRGERPAWIATVTNDGWFGDTSGPRQHLDQARLRTIETGLPMARSANTGVSALFDGAGRLVARVPLYQTGVIDNRLPAPLAPTLYQRLGDLLFWLMMAGVFALAYFPRRRLQKL
ncbi:MAG TPA: apolipoprotein N-acyltransferase [Parvularcula sp.]|nr:apolipoprotein N-acyltransferase [Parvularcula sp.]